MYNSDKLTNIYIKYDITPNQFYILYLTHTKDWHNLHRYKDNVNVETNQKGNRIGGFFREELLPLVEKGYLGDIGNNFEILDLIVTDHFSNELFISYEAGEELWKTYPFYLDINGQKVVAKKGGDFNGKYFGKEELIELYLKKIGHSRDKHNWIIEKLPLAIEQKLINVTIRDFIYNEMWDAFELLEDLGSRKHGFI